MELGAIGWIAGAIGVIIATGYLFSAGSTKGAKVPIGCGCPHEWDPVCVTIPLPDDWELRLAAMNAEQLQRLQEQGHPGAEELKKRLAAEEAEAKDPKAAAYRRMQKPQPMRSPFPNACEARCHGHTQFENGLCPGASKSIKCLFDNHCPSMPGPADAVCWYGFNMPSECAAKCVVETEFQLPWDPAGVKAGKCPEPCKAGLCAGDRVCTPRPGKCFEEPCLTYKCVDVGCNCTREWAPVCGVGVTYTNECFAQCEGLHLLGVKLTPGECAKVDPGYPQPLPFPKPKLKKRRVSAGDESNDATPAAEAPESPAPTA